MGAFITKGVLPELDGDRYIVINPADLQRTKELLDPHIRRVFGSDLDYNVYKIPMSADDPRAERTYALALSSANPKFYFGIGENSILHKAGVKHLIASGEGGFVNAKTVAQVREAADFLQLAANSTITSSPTARSTSVSTSAPATEENSARLYVKRDCGSIGGVTVNLGLGDMTEAKADAYIVPQFQGGPSEGGVGGAICRAGAQLGVIDEYEGVVANEGGKIPFGKAFVTPSHGGKTDKLIHVVSVGSGREREFNTVREALTNGLVAAKAAGIKSIVCPVLGTGIIGALTDEQSAVAMLSAIKRFDDAHPNSGIQVTFISYADPRNKNNPTFLTFQDVLTQRKYSGEGAIPAVGSREFDAARWQGEMQRDIDLGTTPREDNPKGGPTKPANDQHRGPLWKWFTRKADKS